PLGSQGLRIKGLTPTTASLSGCRVGLGPLEENMTTTVAATGSTPTAYQFWDGQKLRSTRACPLALDLETEPIQDERRMPRLALAAASDGRSNVVSHPDRLGAFLLQHRDAFLVAHNLPFDFWVADQHLVGSDARRVLWDACNEGRLFDTQVLDLLLQLGT